jgi:hypothetical protein
LFGAGLVCDIGHVLEWFIDETGFSNLLPNSVCSETKARVYRAILCSYSNTRGKDYSYKKNAMAPPNTEQTLRARLAIASAVAKTKREKSKAAKSVVEKAPAAKRRKVVETASAAPAGKDNTTPSEKEVPIVPVIGMRVEVKYDCGTWTGRIAKVSEGEITGTNKITIKWDVDDYPDDIFDYPDPDGEITLMVNEDGITVAEGDSFFRCNYRRGFE